MTADALIDFVESMTGPALQESPPSPEERLAITLYGVNTSLKSFTDMASAKRRLAHWRTILKL